MSWKLVASVKIAHGALVGQIEQVGHLIKISHGIWHGIAGIDTPALPFVKVAGCLIPIGRELPVVVFRKSEGGRRCEIFGICHFPNLQLLLLGGRVSGRGCGC